MPSLAQAGGGRCSKQAVWTLGAPNRRVLGLDLETGVTWLGIQFGRYNSTFAVSDNLF